MKNVLFVCLGNICRSPTAEGVFRKIVTEAGHLDKIQIDSAGTSNWHIGQPPDSRAIAAAQNRNIDISGLKARQVSASDLAEFDYVIAMDNENLENLIRLAKQANTNGNNVKLFLSFADQYDDIEVPDPYYGGELGFDKVLDMIENASQGLLNTILKEHG